MTLLEKAKAIKSKKWGEPISYQDLELVLSFLDGEITYRQFGECLGKSYGATPGKVIVVLKQAIKMKAIEIKVNKLAFRE